MLPSCLLALVSLAFPRDTLRVSGNQILFNDDPVIFKGVNIPGLESSSRAERSFRSCRVAVEDWQANCIRLPLCEDRWFGKVLGQEGNGDEYRTAVDQIVNYVSRSDGFVILDLEWSDAGVWGKNLAPHKMPDTNSEAFWKEVAKKFRGNGRVLFGLYNEPHDVDWNTWLDGGQVTEGDLKYNAIGLRQLLKDVRSMSAKNVVVVGGLDRAYDLTQASNLQDSTGNGIVYDAHIFPWKTDWDKYVGVVTASAPVVVGACGCSDDPQYETPSTWAPKLLGWMDQKHLGFTASTMLPTAKPTLISDWIYTPTPYWGAYVKAALAKK